MIQIDNVEQQIPIIGKWIITYDENDMPMNIQGISIGNHKQIKNGAPVFIQNIEILDLKENFLKTADGTIIKLIGEGKRVMTLTENEYRLLKDAMLERLEGDFDD